MLDLAVGIGPVTIADYLDQNKIVTHSNENQNQRTEFDQWSGSFKNNVTELLVEKV
ncbi:ABC-type transport auxiliary lipoprotein family protein [Desulfopila aestuarii]|uniref:ABC-type transport auxiliary lipoprotein family protein n=1 Tax=Desulfopila aestuarii TaxID=231440 RepID=UPI000A020369